MLVELSVVEQRYQAVLAVIRDGVPIVQVARRFDVSAVTTSLPSPIAHPSVLRCERCLETGVNYVLKPDTAGGTV